MRQGTFGGSGRFPVFEISSTFIREALDAGKDVRYFVHPKAWEAIQFTPLIDEE